MLSKRLQCGSTLRLTIKLAVLSGMLALRLWQALLSKRHLCKALAAAHSLLCESERRLCLLPPAGACCELAPWPGIAAHASAKVSWQQLGLDVACLLCRMAC